MIASKYSALPTAWARTELTISSRTFTQLDGNGPRPAVNVRLDEVRSHGQSVTAETSMRAARIVSFNVTSSNRGVAGRGDSQP